MGGARPLAVFGGTGKVGRHLVDQALQRGYRVRLLARQPQNVRRADALLEVVEGDVLDPEAVEEVVAGSRAVLSALGHADGSPPDVLTRGIQNVLEAMQRHEVLRLVALTGAGVLRPEDPPRGPLNKVIELLLRRLQGDLLEDSERMVEIITESDRQWVVVRAPFVVEGPVSRDYRTGYLRPEFGSRISRGDIAHFMLRCVEEDTYVGETPLISS